MHAWVSVGMGPNAQDSLRVFVIKRPNEWTASVRREVGQARMNEPRTFPLGRP